ncbi:MAG: hypothetical protein HHAS10_09120 [Candidatus Altimarinota bacterium]
MLIFCILLGGYFSFQLNTGKIYDEYSNLWDYRILHPETLPDTDLIELTVAGNTNSFADTLWIQLIQYIGDNIFNEGYNNFLNAIVEKITILHPHFSEAYNLALILSPNVNTDREDYEKRRQVTLEALRIGEKGIQENCNQEKLQKIYSSEIGRELWNNSELKNPCNDSMLAYNVAITANELGEYSKAEQYFKVASLEEDGPKAAQFLGPLMQAKLGDYKSSGERFLLIAAGAYDEDPYTCQKETALLLKKYKTTSFQDFIGGLGTYEKNLKHPKTGDNIIASSGNTCYGFNIRAIKQFYLGFISEITKNHPEVTTGSGILEKGLLKFIPTIQDQNGWTVRKKDGQWQFQEK